MKTSGFKRVDSQNKKGPIGMVFKELAGKDQKAFIPFITCGYPDIEGFIQTYELLDKRGADIIEVGIPFSDPLADGYVIQKTSKIAIENGVNTDRVFDAVKRIREKSNTPIVFLVYFNMIYKYGIKRFLNKAAAVGANGVIIPDLPLEEYENYSKFFLGSGIENIMIASLTSDVYRLRAIGKAGKGFLYCVSLKGVTGIRDGFSDELEEFLGRLRILLDLPLAVGFGISTPEQVKSIKNKCDGIIIGSKILDILLKEKDFNKGLKKLDEFIMKIITALKT